MGTGIRALAVAPSADSGCGNSAGRRVAAREGCRRSSIVSIIEFQALQPGQRPM
jgi:hypothetical protein